jgi:hypothetical protein
MQTFCHCDNSQTVDLETHQTQIHKLLQHIHCHQLAAVGLTSNVVCYVSSGYSLCASESRSFLEKSPGRKLSSHAHYLQILPLQIHAHSLIEFLQMWIKYEPPACEVLSESHSMPNYHRKEQFSNHPSPVLMKVGELVDSLENSIRAKFQHSVVQFLWCRGAKFIKT